VAGRYHPGWVGHRTVVTTARDLHHFWTAPPVQFLEPATLVPIGRDAPGFVRPCYGLGVMADPGSPLGLIIGHGGGGPGYSTAVFAAPQHDAVAIVLEPAEDFPAQELARDLLNASIVQS
jgi:D-alanyl-D-alanine carboxypeptidase